MSRTINESLTEGLQQELLDALFDGDLRTFKRLLQHPAVNPAYKYGKPHYGTCLEIASRHPEFNHECLKELLTKVKPNVNHTVPEPIHYAASRANVKALELLLKDKRTRVNAQDSNGCTALHHLVLKFPDGAESEPFVHCLQLLLCHPLINVNIPNDKGYTPIHQAMNSPGGKTAILAFLEYSKGLVLDLDSFRGRGRSARESILLKFPELNEVLPKALPRHGLNDGIQYQGEKT